LEQGDALRQPVFHARYEAMPSGARAELISGVVYMPSPLSAAHGRFHMMLNLWLAKYWAATPGTEALDNVTVVLGEDSEVQPDACLRIVGGRSHEDARQYLVGSPELVAEVASGSESYDLHAKLREYERFEVQEYLVLVVREARVVWHIRRGAKFVERSAEPDGNFRSQSFPGLWLDAGALFRLDAAGLERVLDNGLNSAEHSAFVRELASREASQ
jgi:Uma2 family endonuclease